MRVSNNMMANNYLYYLNQNQQAQMDQQEQMSDGKKVHKPSDDPVVTARSLMYNSDLTMNDQFQKKAAEANSFMEATDGALSSIENIFKRVKEITVNAANGTNTQSEYSAMATEIDGHIATLVQVGNTAIGDRYIFAGTNDREAPFKMTDATSPVEYVGNDGKISMRLQIGKNISDQDSVNITGNELFGENAGAIKVLQDISALLKSNGTKISENFSNEMSGKLTELDNSYYNVLDRHAYIGSRMNSNETRGDVLLTNNVAITKTLADNEDLDIPAAIINMKNTENVYQMSLQIGAKILPKSLIDFL